MNTSTTLTRQHSVENEQGKITNSKYTVIQEETLLKEVIEKE